MAQLETNRTRNHEVAGLIPGLASDQARIWRCRELWCMSQTQLGSCVAVAMAVAGNCSSDSAPSLGTFICCGCGPKKQKKKKKKGIWLVTVVVQVQSLAQELPHAASTAKKKMHEGSLYLLGL